MRKHLAVNDLSNYDELEVVEMLEKVSLSVVNIGTLKLMQRNFYQAVPVRGAGSGIIIEEDGLILTNRHVIEGAKEIAIAFTDGSVVKGIIIGGCTTHDIAVIQVEKKDLPVAELGDSEKVRVGQRVYAIGNPLGLVGGPSVTFGVVSALNRTIKTQKGMIEGLLQTDAAINPGNSGGALIDMQGNIIGVNTAIIPFAQGIGFAIPMNIAKQCGTEIVANGAHTKAFLGISGLTLTKEAAAYYGFPTEQGVFLAQVGRGSPAEKAGIIPGDIVLEFNGKEINTAEELVAETEKINPGDKVEIVILRQAKKRTVSAILEATP